MRYSKPQKEESNNIVNVHLKAFKNFFLTKLGKSFLNTYYFAVIKSQSSIAYCAYDSENNIVGFVTGCYISKGYNRSLLMENLIGFMFQVLKLVVIKPVSLIRLFKNSSKRKLKSDDGKYAELLSIAVLPEYTGLKIGSDLLKYFENDARKLGNDKIVLTTDYYENDNVIAFYLKNGYQIYYDFYAYPNRRMYKLLKNI